MSTATLITLDGISKRYQSYARDIDRVLEILTGKPRHQVYDALQPLSLQVASGEVIGVIGKNGAGKSTLLKILAGTLQSSTGTVAIKGRVSAILELGASFHPEMTGHDNVYLTCAIQGLSRRETEAAYDAIVEFAGIGEFMQRPVKTYSSGMVMRLAFSLATNVNPDILIVDEALSVGDGEFARRSFDRIMDFRKNGKTIFFCSHSLYQVEALCDRVLWLDHGRLRSEGEPARVITEYGEFLQREVAEQTAHAQAHAVAAPTSMAAASTADVPRVTGVNVRVDGHQAKVHKVQSSKSLVEIEVDFRAPAALPVPSVAIVILSGDGRVIASAGTVNDGIALQRTADQAGKATLALPAFPLLKGGYFIDVYLMCERGLMVYERVRQVAELNVEQRSLEPGIVSLPHQWTVR
ncbi:MAG TPA: ABC transporter ATP-binding protein [Candidatus Acidoferrum sp.]|nr:ABC transporter ATP-binding protein [Candidatus Acidoferrum sp.]